MATQKGRNWSSGDIVTAANLSSIERGVSAVAEEYTPTTWANGNTVTAAALNNIEQGIANAGGSSWTTLTEESVTTEGQPPLGAISDLSYAQLISANTIRVTFDGIEYECSRIDREIDGISYNLYGGIGEEGPDFSQYPFLLQSTEDSGVFYNVIGTETAGTYSVKIEAPQGGGSSDFSTAEVTYSSSYMNGIYLAFVDQQSSSIIPIMDSDGTYQVVLYQGSAWGLCPEGSVSVTGSIQYDNGILTITGDGTITISGESSGDDPIK